MPTSTGNICCTMIQPEKNTSLTTIGFLEHAAIWPSWSKNHDLLFSRNLTVDTKSERVQQLNIQSCNCVQIVLQMGTNSFVFQKQLCVMWCHMIKFSKNLWPLRADIRGECCIEMALISFLDKSPMNTYTSFFHLVCLLMETTHALSYHQISCFVLQMSWSPFRIFPIE